MSDAFRPITTEQRLELPWNYVLYTTTRVVPAEKALPQIGALMSTEMAGFATRILDVSAVPDGNGKKRLSIQHGDLPSNHDEHESVAYTFPPIYPTAGLTKYAGGSQPRPMIVPARVSYEYAIKGGGAFTAWLGTNNTAFQVQSNIAKDAAEPYEDPPDSGEYQRIGDWLNGTFIFQNTVHNPINISIPGVLAYSIAASVPSASAYVSWILNRTELVAHQYITRWRGDIYMRVTKRVQAQ